MAKLHQHIVHDNIHD